jgi:hypothetical protein
LNFAVDKYVGNNDCGEPKLMLIVALAQLDVLLWVGLGP